MRRRQKISGVLVLVCTDVFFGRGQGKVGGGGGGGGGAGRL